MNRSLNRIIVILVLLFLLPALFYTVSEVNSLSENERVISEIYSQQLETILFSINQYAEDVVNSWASSINLILAKGGKGVENEMESLVRENTSIMAIVVADEKQSENTRIYATDSTLLGSQAREQIASFNRSKTSLLERLKKFQESGYRKIEPIASTPFSTDTTNSSLLFLLNEPVDGNSFCYIIINPETFIQQTLSPKIQSAGQERFFIGAFRKGSTYSIYGADSQSNEQTFQKKELWLMPDYYLLISFKSKSIEELVKERSMSNIFLLLGIEIILLLAMWLVFRNIRKEVSLAQQKTDFVSNVSHEIRTPLSLISMFAETLQMDRVKTEEMKMEYYEIIGQEANRLAGIVNKILNFSRIEANKMKYSVTATDLNELTKETLRNYYQHIKSNGFTCAFEPAENLEPLNLDREAVKEALMNLLDNAIKYSQDAKILKVSTGSQGGYAYIEVQDQGIGIAKKDQKLIFDKFFRVSSGLVHNTKGTGLGLSLVKHIMLAHQGKVTLVSNVGEGSTFRLNFPMNGK